MSLDKAFWEEYAQLYEFGVCGMEPYRALARRVLHSAALRPEYSVLDAGCGVGYYSHAAAQLTASVRGLDGNKAMLQRARLMCANDRNVTISEADFNLPGWHAELGRFDAVLSVNVLYAVRDPDDYLRSLHALLRAGGRLVLSNPWSPRLDLVIAAQNRWLSGDLTPEEQGRARLWNDVWPRVLEMNQTIANAAKGHSVHFWDAEQACTALNGAGFAVQVVEDDAYEGGNLLVVATT
ncbi:class I SAM-dependent methyltransferase [Patescibacteria group bacterium]|nr:class I SAM-dependent methyltransferase [Patescibacteria group bacterium]